MSQNKILDILEHVEKRIALPQHVEIKKEIKKETVIQFALKRIEDPLRGFFRLTGFTRNEFDLLLRIIQHETIQHRGREKSINNFDDQLFLLLNFLHLGSTTLTHQLASSYYETLGATTQLLHSIVRDIKLPLIDIFLTYRPDRVDELRDVALAVDCTIIPTNRPEGTLSNGKKFFSGKHHIYCTKVEVGVNLKVGTASTISDIYPGSTHDYTIFKDHYPIFCSKLGGSKIIADSAYIGAKSEFGAVITKPVGTPELAKHRVIIERFFGQPTNCERYGSKSSYFH